MTDINAYPHDSTMSTAVNEVTSSIMSLSDEIFLPIESSSRNRMTKTMLQAQLLSQLDRIAFQVANITAASAPSTEMRRRVKVVVLRQALKWYGEVVSAASFADFDQKLSEILESRDDLATIQGIEDYDLFEVDHLPRLQRIVDAIRGIENTLEIPELTDYTPTFTIADFNEAMNGIGDYLPTDTNINGVDIKARMPYVKEILSKLFSSSDETLGEKAPESGIKESTRITSLFDVLVLLDRALLRHDPIVDGENQLQLSVFGVEEHIVLAAQSILGLPYSPINHDQPTAHGIVHAIPGPDGSYWNEIAHGETIGDDKSKTVDTAKKEWSASVPLAEMLAMVVVHCSLDERSRASAVSLLALPLHTHKLYKPMSTVFAKAYRSRIPDIELNTFKLLQSLVSGGDTINAKDALVKFRAAINRDTSSVGHAVIDAYSAESVSKVNDLVDQAVNKMYVREPQMRETFKGTNLFRMEREPTDVLDDGTVTWGAPNPFQYRPDHITTHPEAFSEAVVKVNRLAGSRIMDSTGIPTVRPLLEDLYHFDDTVVSNVSRKYGIHAILDEITTDWHDKTTLAINPIVVGESVSVADTIVGVANKTAGDADSIEIYGSLQNSASVTLAKSRIRMECVSTVHKMWGKTGMVQSYVGPQASSDVITWVQSAASLANNLIASYARAPIAICVDAFSVLPNVENAKYRDRIGRIDNEFRPFRESLAMRRFMSNPTVAKYLRDRIDVDLFINPGIEYRVNQAISKELASYATSVATVLNTTYKKNSDVMEFMRRFVSGEVTMVEVSANEERVYSPIVAATVEMLVGNISKENTLLSLLLIDHFVNALK